MRFYNTFFSAFILVLIASIFSSLSVVAENNSYWQNSNIEITGDRYQRLLRLSGDSLIRRGYTYLDDVNMADSALLCFTIVAERMDEVLNPKQQKECFDAWCGRWVTNFSAYSNYNAAIDDYNKIIELQKRWNIKSAYPAYFLSLQKCAEFNIDPERNNMDESLNLMKEAFDTAISLKEKDLAFRTFMNLAKCSMIHPVGNLDKAFVKLESLLGKENRNTLIASKLLEVYRCEQKKDSRNALLQLDDALKLLQVENSGLVERGNILGLYFLRASFLKSLGRYIDAETAFQQLIDLTYRFNNPSFRQWALEELAPVYEETGQREKLEKTLHHAVLLKDSLWNTRITKGLEQLKFNDQHNEMLQHIAVMEYRQKVSRVVAVIVAFALLCICIFVWYLIRVNRKLHERNNILYDSLKTGKIKLYSQIPSIFTVNEHNVQAESEPELSAESVARDISAVEKESKPLLSDDMRNELAEKIRSVINNSDAPLSGDFSLAKLSQLCGTNTRYCSYVINEELGCNFQTLVNSARIREACIRMDNHREYGEYTVEAIGESVGFNSRSAFMSAFRRYTGLSTSEYRKISIERYKKGMR